MTLTKFRRQNQYKCVCNLDITEQPTTKQKLPRDQVKFQALNRLSAKIIKIRYNVNSRIHQEISQIFIVKSKELFLIEPQML